MQAQTPERLLTSLLPCATCPWRVGQDASTIPNYDHALACGLLGTVGEEDDFRKIMSCHGSTPDHPFACKGYLAREGWRNINVRLLLARHEIANPTAVLAAYEKSGIRLHRNYPSVLRKLAKSYRRIQCTR